jgi:hypothetical protein
VLLIATLAKQGENIEIKDEVLCEIITAKEVKMSELRSSA